MPKVSIVMPTYNQWDHIQDALVGLQKQVFQDFDLVIVVDGNPDRNADYNRINPAILRKTTIVNYLDNRGTAYALNMGFRLCTGKYWTWVSSDNVMHPNWLEKMVEYLDNNKQKDVVYSAYIRETGEIKEHEWCCCDRKMYAQIPYQEDRMIGDQNCFIGPAFLYRSWLQYAVGDVRGKISHDYDWWLRAEEADAKFGVIYEPLCTYRVHDERVTVTRKNEYDAHHWQEEAKKRRGMM
jgi:glycosyltransferase involved in cell wall biosynthesis